MVFSLLGMIKTAWKRNSMGWQFSRNEKLPNHGNRNCAFGGVWGECGYLDGCQWGKHWSCRTTLGSL